MENKRDAIDMQVAKERARQDKKWGVQNHKDGTGAEFAAHADAAKEICRMAASDGTITWHDILREEYFEAMAESDQKKLKTELIQCAAVIKAWIECIDRRTN